MGTLLPAPREERGPPGRGGGDNGPPWGPAAAARAGAGIGDQTGTQDPQWDISGSPNHSQPRHSTPPQQNSPGTCRLGGRPWGQPGLCTATEGPSPGHRAQRPGWEAVGRDSIFSLPQAPTTCQEGPTAARGRQVPGKGVASPASHQRPTKPPSSHPVKPVSNWGGVTARRSGRSAVKPDPTVPTPKQQGKTRPLLSQMPTLSCWVFRAPRGSRALMAPQGPPRAGGSSPFPPHVPSTCGVGTPPRLTVPPHHSLTSRGFLVGVPPCPPHELPCPPFPPTPFCPTEPPSAQPALRCFHPAQPHGTPKCPVAHLDPHCLTVPPKCPKTPPKFPMTPPKCPTEPRGLYCPTIPQSAPRHPRSASQSP